MLLPSTLHLLRPRMPRRSLRAEKWFSTSKLTPDGSNSSNYLTLTFRGWLKLHHRILRSTPLVLSLPPPSSSLSPKSTFFSSNLHYVSSSIPYTLFSVSDAQSLQPSIQFTAKHTSPQLHLPTSLVLHRCWTSAHHLAALISASIRSKTLNESNSMHGMAFLCPSRPGYFSPRVDTLGQELHVLVKLLSLLGISRLDWLIARGVGTLSALEFIRMFPQKVVNGVILIDPVLSPRPPIPQTFINKGSMVCKEIWNNALDLQSWSIWKKRYTQSDMSSKGVFDISRFRDQAMLQWGLDALRVNGSQRRSGTLSDLQRMRHVPPSLIFQDAPKIPIIVISTSTGSAYSFPNGLEDVSLSKLDSKWLRNHLGENRVVLLDIERRKDSTLVENEIELANMVARVLHSDSHLEGP